MLPVYVVHWNAPGWCEETVASLLGSEDIDLTVTVIDNGSKNLPRLPAHVEITRMPSNRGFAGAANLALELSHDSEFLAIASHDVRVAPDAIARTVAFAERNPDHGILGLEGGGENDLDGGGWISGTFMLIRRACAESVGAFDELFGSYLEDVDYCHRATREGWKIAIVAGAHASEKGSAHHRRAQVLMQANWIVLLAKERQWRGFAHHLAGALRRCATQPSRGTLGVIGLASWRLLRLAVRRTELHRLP